MEDRQIANSMASRKLIAVVLILSVLLATSVVALTYQRSAIEGYKVNVEAYKIERDLDRREVLAAAKEAFEEYYKLMANTSNIHVLDNFSHDIVFNNQTRQWFVAFRYTDEGISATTV